MTRYLDDDPMTPADFEALFDDEPASPDPASDLARGRRLRGRRRLAGGLVALVAVVAVALGATSSAAYLSGARVAGPADHPSAVPSPVRTLPGPTPWTTVGTTPTIPSSPPGAGPARAPRDTAPVLRRDVRGNYLDAEGHRLGGSIMGQHHEVNPFHTTTENSWRLAVEHLDPSRDHLADYEAFAFTGGSSGGEGIQVGQKIGWTVHGERGEGVVQLAVSRLGPGTSARLGSGHDDADGFCNDAYLPEQTCRRTTVAGVAVYAARTPDGGFVMDRLQDDGEVASIIVSPLFGNNTSVPLHTMHVTPEAAAALLDDPGLDVVG